MGLKKSGIGKGKSGLQDSKLFGIMDRVIPKILGKKTIKDHEVRWNHEARRLALASRRKAEYYKAKAMIYVREISVR